MQGGCDTDAFEQIVRDETDAKRASECLGDQGIAVLGENQGIDARGDEVVEQMACVIGRCAHGDRWPQGAVIVGDDGSEALVALPNAADIHGRNSSKAV